MGTAAGRFDRQAFGLLGRTRERANRIPSTSFYFIFACSPAPVAVAVAVAIAAVPGDRRRRQTADRDRSGTNVFVASFWSLPIPPIFCSFRSFVLSFVCSFLFISFFMTSACTSAVASVASVAVSVASPRPPFHGVVRPAARLFASSAASLSPSAIAHEPVALPAALFRRLPGRHAAGLSDGRPVGPQRQPDNARRGAGHPRVPGRRRRLRPLPHRQACVVYVFLCFVLVPLILPLTPPPQGKSFGTRTSAAALPSGSSCPML